MKVVSVTIAAESVDSFLVALARAGIGDVQESDLEPWHCRSAAVHFEVFALDYDAEVIATIIASACPGTWPRIAGS